MSEDHEEGPSQSTVVKLVICTSRHIRAGHMVSVWSPRLCQPVWLRLVPSPGSPDRAPTCRQRKHVQGLTSCPCGPATAPSPRFFHPRRLPTEHKSWCFQQVPSVFRWQPIWYLPENSCRQDRFPQTFGFQRQVSEKFPSSSGMFIFTASKRRRKRKKKIVGQASAEQETVLRYSLCVVFKLFWASFFQGERKVFTSLF